MRLLLREIEGLERIGAPREGIGCWLWGWGRRGRKGRGY